MTDHPFVSVIIPHFNDLGGLAICLDALSRQSYPADRREIIVADNDSPMGEARVAEVIAGRARLVVVRERGAGPARNGAVAASRGEILAFTDSDCKAAPDWIAEGVAALAAWDFVGGRMEVSVHDPSQMTPEEAFETVFAFDNRTYVEKKRFTVTANLLCPRRVFDSVGGFRTGVSEDLEWSTRAGNAGFRIGYAAAAVVEHPARRSWPDLVGKWRRLNAETFGLFENRRAGRLHWLIRSMALPVSAVAHTPKVLRHEGLRSWGARAGALRTLYRLRFWRLVDSVRLLQRKAG